MKFFSRRLVMPNDLNYANSLFGGRALEWIDEEGHLFNVSTRNQLLSDKAYWCY